MWARPGPTAGMGLVGRMDRDESNREHNDRGESKKQGFFMRDLRIDWTGNRDLQTRNRLRGRKSSLAISITRGDGHNGNSCLTGALEQCFAIE